MFSTELKPAAPKASKFFPSVEACKVLHTLTHLIFHNFQESCGIFRVLPSDPRLVPSLLTPFSGQSFELFLNNKSSPSEKLMCIRLLAHIISQYESLSVLNVYLVSDRLD